MRGGVRDHGGDVHACSKMSLPAKPTPPRDLSSPFSWTPRGCHGLPSPKPTFRDRDLPAGLLSPHPFTPAAFRQQLS